MEALEQQYCEAKERFEDAVRSGPLDDQDLLDAYGLFKQAESNDAPVPAPFFPPWKVKERRKFEAWQARSGLSREEAMDEYVRLIENIVPAN